jgi:hypothetical protein
LDYKKKLGIENKALFIEVESINDIKQGPTKMYIPIGKIDKVVIEHEIKKQMPNDAKWIIQDYLNGVSPRGGKRTTRRNKKSNRHSKKKIIRNKYKKSTYKNKK